MGVFKDSAHLSLFLKLKKGFKEFAPKEYSNVIAYNVLGEKSNMDALRKLLISDSKQFPRVPSYVATLGQELASQKGDLQPKIVKLFIG